MVYTNQTQTHTHTDTTCGVRPKRIARRSVCLFDTQFNQSARPLRFHPQPPPPPPQTKHQTPHHQSAAKHGQQHTATHATTSAVERRLHRDAAPRDGDRRHRGVGHRVAGAAGRRLQRAGVRLGGVQVHADGQLQVRPEELLVLQGVLQLSQLFVHGVLQLCG